jgi:hypothetical protein
MKGYRYYKIKKRKIFLYRFNIYSIMPVRAINSAVECYPHMVEVTGSNPVSPTLTPAPLPGFSICRGQ